ncbi:MULTISPECIES: hypothetical protein [unclassified Nocardia]|uniref:hypothetical protein n=1 Tax=unclassified Nocardia TaxID=2637762 RepID=UPI001CE4B099|nr:MULTISPECIES: hypothetical protein [unclassified Nocardia]
MIDTRSRWQHTTLTTDFLAESCCVADMNGDGIDELVAGDRWWPIDRSPCTPTRFRTIARTWLPRWGGGDRPDPHPHLRESSGGPPQYRAATYDWPLRSSDRGRADALLSIGMHQDPIRRYDPRPDPAQWEPHDVVHGGIYESAVYADLDTEGTAGLVTVPDRPRVAWYEPAPDPRAPWLEHPVGDRGGNWHGLGVGVLDTDNQPHILTPTGTYRCDGDIRRPWRWSALLSIDEFGRAGEGLGDVCLIHPHRLYPDHPATLFAASPHGYGLWRWDLVEVTPARRVYQRAALESATSQLHALAVLGATGGEPVDAWVITGKRWQAHGPDHDPDPRGTPVLFRVGVHSDPAVPPRVELIDDHSGVGLHFAARRLGDGRMQIATANKLGVHLLTEND